MSLESTPIETPTTKEIEEFIVNDYKSRQGVTFLSITGIVATIARALAGIYILIYRFGTWSFNQIFFASADSFYKKERGKEYGIIQGTGTKAKMSATISGGVAASLLPAGSLYEFEDSVYKTLSDATVDGGGNLSAEIQASDIGTQFTLQAGTELKIVSPLAGIPENIYIDSIVTDGEDGQPDSEYFDQIDARIKLPPQGGSPADYFQWVVGVDGLADLVLYEQVSGEIKVYPIANGEGAARFPSAADKQNAADAIETSGKFVYNDRRPIGADVSIEDILNEDYRVEVYGFTANGGNPTIAATIDAEITSYIESRRPENIGLGKTGEITEVSKNIIFSIVNTITLANGFSVDNVKVYVLMPPDPEEEIIVKRKLPEATIASLSAVDYDV